MSKLFALLEKNSFSSSAVLQEVPKLYEEFEEDFNDPTLAKIYRSLDLLRNPALYKSLNDEYLKYRSSKQETVDFEVLLSHLEISDKEKIANGVKNLKKNQPDNQLDMYCFDEVQSLLYRVISDQKILEPFLHACEYHKKHLERHYHGREKSDEKKLVDEMIKSLTELSESPFAIEKKLKNCHEAVIELSGRTPDAANMDDLSLRILDTSTQGFIRTIAQYHKNYLENQIKNSINYANNTGNQKLNNYKKPAFETMEVQGYLRRNAWDLGGLAIGSLLLILGAVGLILGGPLLLTVIDPAFIGLCLVGSSISSIKERENGLKKYREGILELKNENQKEIEAIESESSTTNRQLSIDEKLIKGEYSSIQRKTPPLRQITAGAIPLAGMPRNNFFSPSDKTADTIPENNADDTPKRRF